MNIYAIIVTYNAMRNSWIEKCLLSLRSSTLPVTAIVVDNGSSDATRSFVPASFPDAVWLPQERNLGFGQANNIGITYALDHRADYVLLLNQDATLAADAISQMLPNADDNSLLSPLHLNGDGTLLDASFKTCLLLSDTTLVDDLLVRHATASAYATPLSHVPAACWLLPASVVKKVGGFNPLFFHYGEDENYFRRLAYHRVAVKVCPAATMYHDRHLHGNMAAFSKGMCRRFLLTAASDINHSFGARLLEYALILKRSYIKYLPQRQYRPGEFLIGLFWLLGHLRSIANSRKAEKVANSATWLTLSETKP